jgi:hypothetical protein
VLAASSYDRAVNSAICSQVRGSLAQQALQYRFHCYKERIKALPSQLRSSHENDTSSGNCSLRQNILTLHRTAAADLPETTTLLLSFTVVLENAKQFIAIF